MTPEGGHLFDRPDEELGRIQAGLRQLADQYGMLRGLLDAVLAIGAELELEPVLHRIVEAGRGWCGPATAPWAY